MVNGMRAMCWALDIEARNDGITPWEEHEVCPCNIKRLLAKWVLVISGRMEGWDFLERLLEMWGMATLTLTEMAVTLVGVIKATTASN
jgi:hypothetical protein